MPEPLRKKRADGSPYFRPKEVEATTAALQLLPTEELVERAKIRDSQSSEYVPSECLLYFVRRAREGSEIETFRELFLGLRQRILAATPVFERKSTGSSKSAAKMTEINVQEAVLDSFNEMLCNDRIDYDDRLDYFEIRFNSALARLRSTARRAALKRDSRTESMSFEEGSNAPSLEVEAAIARLKDTEEIPDFLYRSRLVAAIDTLPADEKIVIELLLLDFPIDSTDPEVFTISKALGCTEKTVRNRRDRAFSRLCAELGEGEGK